MLSIQQCRKFLGNLNSQLNDKQIEQIRDSLIEIINTLWKVKNGN